MRPPGNTHAPPWNASFDERRPSSTSRPFSPSRSNTTVAAGAATTPFAASSHFPLRRCSIQLFNAELTLFVLRPQDLLVEFPDRRLRDLRDEAPSFRHLPLRDVLREVGREHRGVGVAPRLADDTGERTLVPARVRNPDDARLED